MSSDSQIVESLQLNNYTSLVIVTAVAYDYIITFPRELKYIWNRPWSLVTPMFIIVRYLGILIVMFFALNGTTFVPGPALVGTTLLLISVWGFVVFLAAADIIMILRVYAMYRRSRIVLGVLLVLYAFTIVLQAVVAGYYYDPRTHMTMTGSHLFNMSFCSVTFNTTSDLDRYQLIPRISLAALMFVLVVARFCEESYRTYKATKQWQANRYFELLFREGILYFLAHLFYSINLGQTLAGFVMSTFTFILVYTLSPRFIMNVRELVERNVIIGQGIDTGFGFTSRAPEVSAIGFADPGTTLVTQGDIELRRV